MPTAIKRARAAAGGILSSRDLHGFRVKVLNTAKLNKALTARVDRQLELTDSLDGADHRPLLTRALEVLVQLAENPEVQDAVRMGAARTVIEAVNAVTANSITAQAKKLELMQKSREHADRMRLEDRKVQVLESRLGGGDPLGAVSLDDLKRLRDGTPEAE